jgi:hypothetical protein
LDYDATTGTFVRRVKRRKFLAGSESGCLDKSSGYVVMHLDGKKYQAHRLVFLYVEGNFPKDHVDHINGIRHDNRYENLRRATISENSRNRKIMITNKSGFKGVFWNPKNKVWTAKIYLNGKRVYLGSFHDPAKAHAAYCAAAKSHYAEFARMG